MDTGDREITVTDATNCILFEFYGSPQNNATSWITSASAKWNLRSNALRPEGWESGDQPGLPFLAGFMRWEEVAAGEIGHAIRITARNPSSLHIWPARHSSSAGASADTSLPPMGARFRLKASFDISGFDARTQIVLRAFKQYGFVLASGGGDWFMQGVSNTGWPDVVIGELRSITGSNFEAVDTAPMIVDINSGQAVQPSSGGGGGGGGGGGTPHPEDGFPPGGMPSGWIQPSGSSAAWVVANDASYGGTLSLKSGFIGDRQKSGVSVTRGFVSGSVSFVRKVSSQATDALEFAIDGVVQGRWSGDQDWAVVSFPIPAGPHTLTWRYVKDFVGFIGRRRRVDRRGDTAQAVVCLAVAGAALATSPGGRPPASRVRSLPLHFAVRLHLVDEFVGVGKRRGPAPHDSHPDLRLDEAARAARVIRESVATLP